MSHRAARPLYFGLLASGGSRWDKSSPCVTSLLLTPRMVPLGAALGPQAWEGEHGFPGGNPMGCSFPTSSGLSLWDKGTTKRDLGDACRVQPGCNHNPSTTMGLSLSLQPSTISLLVTWRGAGAAKAGPCSMRGAQTRHYRDITRLLPGPGCSHGWKRGNHQQGAGISPSLPPSRRQEQA